MGILLGLLTAIFFSASSVMVKVGQRTEPSDNGVYTTVFVNVVLLGVVALFGSKADWQTSAVVALIIGGIVGVVFGRSMMLWAVRLIGPARTAAFTTGTPVAAAVGGWLLLDETISPLEAAGGVITAAGLLWLVRSRSSGSEAPRPPVQHYLIAAAAPVFFGLAFVARKWGLDRLDSTLVAAFLSTLAGFVFMTVFGLLRGESRTQLRRLTHANRWFLLAGVATGLAILSQFLAFGFLEAWVVGLLVGTQGIWTLGFSAAFLRGEEYIDRNVVGAILVVAVGVAVVGFQT